MGWIVLLHGIVVASSMSSSTIASAASSIVIVVCLLLGQCIILLMCRDGWCRGHGHGWHMVDHWWSRRKCIVLDWRRGWELDVCRYLITDTCDSGTLSGPVSLTLVERSNAVT